MKSFIKILEEMNLDEASYPGRASSGKLKKIDALMSWLYNKNIFNKGEKAQKDKLFYSYYRWYNDGDIPKRKAYSNFRGMGGYMSKEMQKQISIILEDEIEQFIKKMLKKYLPKIDRTDFRYDYALKELQTIHNADPYSLVNYYKKSIKDTATLEKIDDLGKLLSKFKEITPAEYKNTTASYSMQSMEKKKQLTPEIKSLYKQIEQKHNEIKIDIDELIKLTKISKIQNSKK